MPSGLCSRNLTLPSTPIHTTALASPHVPDPLPIPSNVKHTHTREQSVPLPPKHGPHPHITSDICQKIRKFEPSPPIPIIHHLDRAKLFVLETVGYSVCTSILKQRFDLSGHAGCVCVDGVEGHFFAVCEAA